MQKLIAKYGAAANLALLAVAPLFLFPFLSDADIATTLLWLSVSAFFWFILEPSVLRGETLHHARRRVIGALCADPLFWVSLVLVLLAGFQVLNDGVALVYDAESTKWTLSPPLFSLLPGCVEGTGNLWFATFLAGAVLMQGCRHALGASARMAFLLTASTLAGIAAILALCLFVGGNPVVRAAIDCSAMVSSYVGVAFYLHLLSATVALVAAFERGWNMMLPLFIVSIGGTIAAGFLFSPVLVSFVFLSAEILLLVYIVVYAVKMLATASEFKLLVLSGVAFVLGGLLSMTLAPAATMERVSAFEIFELLPESFVVVRETLSGVAMRSWLENLWLGTGLGSFPLAFRFSALPDDLQIIRFGAEAVPNGWLFLLAERGIIGALTIGLPIGFLLFTYFRRLAQWVTSQTYCHPACCLGPLVLVSLIVTGLYGCSLLRADVMLMAMALLAVSANSFPRKKRKDNG